MFSGQFLINSGQETENWLFLGIFLSLHLVTSTLPSAVSLISIVIDCHFIAFASVGEADLKRITYMGCYNDASNDLSVNVWSDNSWGGMTSQFCAGLCKSDK